PGSKPDIQNPPVRADRHHRWAARGRHLALRRQPAGAGVDGEADDLVFILQANVKMVCHCAPSLRSVTARYWRILPRWLQGENGAAPCKTGMHAVGLGSAHPG